MSIRMVAVELYRVIQETEALEKKLESLKAGSQERLEAEIRLRKARGEMDRLKKMIEGAKAD
jgi:hypothetical protein